MNCGDLRRSSLCVTSFHQSSGITLREILTSSRGWLPVLLLDLGNADRINGIAAIMEILARLVPIRTRNQTQRMEASSYLVSRRPRAAYSILPDLLSRPRSRHAIDRRSHGRDSVVVAPNEPSRVPCSSHEMCQQNHEGKRYSQCLDFQ